MEGGRERGRGKGGVEGEVEGEGMRERERWRPATNLRLSNQPHPMILRMRVFVQKSYILVYGGISYFLPPFF